MGRLANLAWVSASENQLSGPIPPELGDLSRLRTLSAWGNELTGEIPAELGKLWRLEWLDLSRNSLTGEIPPELARLTFLTGLHLESNQLSGEIPEWLGNRQYLTELEIWGNQLTGCAPGGLAVLGRLDIPSCAPSDAHVSKDVQISRDALVALYNATDGPNWENNDNWLSDKFIGEWYGVVTDEQGRVIKLAAG